MTHPLRSAILIAALAATASWGFDPGVTPPSIAAASRPPARFAGDLGTYKSPLVFDDGRPVRTPADWQDRRREIRRTWDGFLGAWPPLIGWPKFETLDTLQRVGHANHRIRVEAAPGRMLEGYL